MIEETIVARVDDLPLDRFAPLLAESEAGGYQFLRRVADEWASGAHRFDGPGEALLVAECGNRWIGVCGLSIDPYLGDRRIGRIRNVYVLSAFRRNGIARRLVAEAVGRARGRFDRLRLRGDDEGPARLYESLGFRRCQGVPDCTHLLEWPR